MITRLMGLRSKLFPNLTSVKAFILISLVTLSLTIFTSVTVQAKIPNSSLFTNSSGTQGGIVYAPVTLDGREILYIAAKQGTVSNLSQNTISPLQIRVEMYEQNLNRILAKNFNPRRLNITTAKSEQQTVIFVEDGRNLKRRKLMSVTELDAQLYGLSVADLAQEFSEIIRPALIQARLERQPESIQNKVFTSAIALLAIIILNFLFISWYKKLAKQWEQLQEQEPQLNESEISALEEESSTNSEQEEEARTIDYCQQKLAWQRQLNINRLKRWILVISVFILWVLGLAWIAGMFPYTRWLEDWLLTKPLLLGIVLGTILGIKASNVIIDFFLKRFVDRESQTTHISTRRISRLNTFFQVLKGAINSIWILLGTLWFLEKLNIPIIPILAGAGIVGFAISFSSQNLIRDIINGIIMLWEDQFIIGDLINIDGTVGVVENINLRMTQLRQANGTLSTISNSSVSTVHNLTKDWSRIVFNVEVSPEADVNKALGIVRETACGMQTDEEWQDLVIDPVNVLGVNNISHNGIEITLWFKTAPGAQFVLGREFRRRLKYAFDREDIAIGLPQHSLQLENSPVLRLLTTNSNNS